MGLNKKMKPVTSHVLDAGGYFKVSDVTWWF